LPITLKEVTTAMSFLNSRKATGCDGIPVELLRIPLVQELFVTICNDIWNQAALPEDFYQVIFVNIYKGKGSKDSPASYRSIGLLSHAYKMFAIIMLIRIRDTIEERMRTGQEGFRNARGCSDNLFVIRSIINHAIKTGVLLELTFIDYTQAFDTISHEFLQISMEEHGLPPKIREIIGAIYKNAVGRVRGSFGAMSDPFPINRGVLQGDILSPILFIMCLNSIWYRSEEPNDGWLINGEWRLPEVSYADDIALIDILREDSQRRLQKLGDISNTTAALHISLPKTFRMVVKQLEHVTATTQSEANAVAKVHCPVCGRGFLNKKGVASHRRFCLGSFEAEAANPRPRSDQKLDALVKKKKREAIIVSEPRIIYNNEGINNVNSFKYLGAKVMNHGSDEDEVEDRVAKTQGVFISHSGIWRDKNIPLDLKIRLFKVRILSILLYGCESWKVTKKILRNIRGFIARCFARMVNEPYVEMSIVMYFINVMNIIEKRRWKWLGHVIRMDRRRNPYKCLSLLDYSPGSLLAHLPLNIRSLDSRSLAAEDRAGWMNKTFLERITLNMQCP
jgi:hypothetical protein